MTATRGGPRTASGWTPDVVGAALAIAFLLLASSHIAAEDSDRALDALGYLLIVVAGASLALCRRWPAVVLGIVTAVLGTYLVRRYVGGPIYVTGWISLFFLSWRSTRRAAVTGAIALSAVLLIGGVIAGRQTVLLHLVFIGWSASALFLGEAVRNRRSYLTELEERAHHLEHTREEEARRRVAEERLRIARDLHDSVAHAMATINVQAGAAAHVVDRRPAAAKDALDAIQRASADVLDELAAMLRLLRDNGEDANRAPTPGLEHISDLVTSMQNAQQPVRLETQGRLDAVAKPIGTAAYRIVQESLTNVLRHASAAPTVVMMRVDNGQFTLDITDEGPGRDRADGTGSGNGMGLRGMRERAEATGGTFAAGPRSTGGFTVRVDWPVTS